MNVDVNYFFDNTPLTETIFGNHCQRKLINCVEDVLHSEVTCKNLQVLKNRLLVMHEILRAKSNIIGLLESKMLD